MIDLSIKIGITARHGSNNNIFIRPTGATVCTSSRAAVKAKTPRSISNIRRNNNLYTYLKIHNFKSINADNRSLYHFSRINTNNTKNFLKKHFTLFLAGLQISGYRASSKFKNLLGNHKKPSIFTYRTTLKNYLFTYTMIAQRSSPHFF